MKIPKTDILDAQYVHKLEVFVLESVDVHFLQPFVYIKATPDLRLYLQIYEY